MRLTRDSWFPIAVELPGDDFILPLLIRRLDYREGAWIKAKYIEAVRKGTIEERLDLLYPLVAESFQRFAKIDFEKLLGKELHISRDGVDIKIETPDQLLPFYGAERGVADDIFSAILTQSTLSEIEKKRSRRRTASKPSSGEQSPAPPGQKPETTATPVESVGSAGNGDAQNEAKAQSGSTDEASTESQPSSSTNVRSVH